MFEKVNPAHPDKVADRIAGAIVDLAYKAEINPKIAVEVLIGHGVCHAIIETSANIDMAEIKKAIHRIGGKNLVCDIAITPRDRHLAENQSSTVRCGDNGIFKGMPVTEEQKALSNIAKEIYTAYPSDGKYIIDGARLIICQSNADTHKLRVKYSNAEINPIGDWTGGTDVDTGATNRKLGSDMADDASIYVFHADTEGLNFRKAFKAAGFYLSGTCIWKKQSLVLGRSPYQWQHEPVLFGWKKKGKTNGTRAEKNRQFWNLTSRRKAVTIRL